MDRGADWWSGAPVELSGKRFSLLALLLGLFPSCALLCCSSFSRRAPLLPSPDSYMSTRHRTLEVLELGCMCALAYTIAY